MMQSALGQSLATRRRRQHSFPLRRVVESSLRSLGVSSRCEAQRLAELAAADRVQPPACDSFRVSSQPFLLPIISSQAISTVGAILGGAAASFVSDLLGRTRALSCGCVPFIIGWSLIAFGWSAAVLLVGRFLTGIGVGMALALVGVYIAEISPAEVRGALLSTNQLAINAGIVTVRRLLWCRLCPSVPSNQSLHAALFALQIKTNLRLTHAGVCPGSALPGPGLATPRRLRAGAAGGAVRWLVSPPGEPPVARLQGPQGGCGAHGPRASAAPPVHAPGRRQHSNTRRWPRPMCLSSFSSWQVASLRRLTGREDVSEELKGIEVRLVRGQNCKSNPAAVAEAAEKLTQSLASSQDAVAEAAAQPPMTLMETIAKPSLRRPLLLVFGLSIFQCVRLQLRFCPPCAVPILVGVPAESGGVRGNS